MPLNPDKNLYSVAPIGNVIVIGRQISLRGGLVRDQALNLLSCLIIATNASPDEIGACIGDICTTGKTLPRSPTLPVNPVAAFIGEIDPEEQAAIDSIVQQPQAATQPPQLPTLVPPAMQTGRVVNRPQVTPPPKPVIAVLDTDATARAWKGASNA
jgi:hypothetical protein